MKAVAYRESLPITDPDALIDVELPKPEARGHDILVKVKAISVNPVDTKVRMRAAPENGELKVLGWDVSGIVEAAGDEVSLFSPGDEVWYAGSIHRQGANAEFHLVDERIVGNKPKSLTDEQAAALPLTSITAWELLFDRLGVAESKDSNAGTLLIIGAAGGVGSILVQLARRLTSLTIIATASRPDTVEWVTALGAHHVINHHNALTDELKRIDIPEVNIVASLTQTDKHFPEIVDLIAPQGKLGLIDDPPTLDVMPLKRKCVSIHWEFMFARSLFNTPDMIRQHQILNSVADFVDNGEIITTFSENYGKINATNLKRAHQFIESGQSRGKVVLSGF